MASAENDLRPFHEAMRDLARWFDVASTPGMIIGGVAVVLLGRPRITRDLDAVVWLGETTASDFLAVGKRCGFVSRFSDPEEFAERCHIFAMRHVPSKITVDVAIAMLEYEKEAIDHRKSIPILDFAAAVPRPEDLILMKAVAQRDNDIVDIRGIVARQVKLDKRYLRKRAKEFAAMLEQPGIVDLIEQQLRSKPK